MYKINNKYGLIDIKGNIILPIEYRYIYEFSEEMARVEKDKNSIKQISQAIHSL